MPPAARVNDLQAAPGGSGPLANGSGTVNIGGAAAARAGDPTGAGGVISSGSPTVFIGGKPAARVGDASSGGGMLLTGTPTVLIGDRMAIGPLEQPGGGKLDGATIPPVATPRPGSTPGTTPPKSHTAPNKDQKDKAAADKKGEANPDQTAVAKTGDGTVEGLTLLNSPATMELVSAFLKLADGMFGQLAGSMPPGLRDLMGSSLASAQQALGTMQMPALNQSLGQLQGAMQQVSTTMPAETVAAAARGDAPPPEAPNTPPMATPPRLSVGEA